MATGTASRKAKGNATETFFDELATRGHEPLLQNASGTLRFDLVDGKAVEHWSVAIKKGDVSISHKESRADAIVRLERDIFDRIVTGRENATAAALRGVLVPEGDLGLVLSFQRLFPGPPRARDATPTTTRGRKTS